MKLILPDRVVLATVSNSNPSFTGRLLPENPNTGMAKLVDNPIKGVQVNVNGTKLPEFIQFSSDTRVKILRFKLTKRKDFHYNKTLEISVVVNNKTCGKDTVTLVV